MLVGPLGVGDVDVEAACADYLSRGVDGSVADHDDSASAAISVDYAMPTAEWRTVACDFVEEGGDGGLVVGVFVVQQQFGGRSDCAGE